LDLFDALALLDFEFPDDFSELRSGDFGFSGALGSGTGVPGEVSVLGCSAGSF